MITLLDTNDLKPRLRHPEKASSPDLPLLPKPGWLRVRAPGSPGYVQTRDIVRDHRLHTVCEEAACPNIGECWQKRHATMMIMGSICTRACAFCNVATGRPGPLDAGEPQRVAGAVAQLALEHVVVTSVDRDDLADGGARHFAETIRAIRTSSPMTTIEVLTPDFLRKDGGLETVIDGATGRVQSQSRNGSRPLLEDPTGRALLPFASPLAARQGNRSAGLHEIRHHGRAW